MSAIAELRTLHDGFLGRGSLAPTEVALHNLALLGAVGPGVHIGPTASGGVALEWRSQECEYTAEIEADGMLFMCIDDPADDVAEVEIGFATNVLREFIQFGKLPADV